MKNVFGEGEHISRKKNAGEYFIGICSPQKGR
jgi:hypothetical protein